jgi:DNA replicative helicase MCM subunit Mcm2 (Cdc46/Mcm family)
MNSRVKFIDFNVFVHSQWCAEKHNSSNIGSSFSGYVKYIREFRIRFRGVPKETRVNIYNIRARHINKSIMVEGVVMKVSWNCRNDS